MRLSAFSLVLFFVCLNVSLYIINETGVITQDEYGVMEPYENPSNLQSRLIYLDLTTESLLMAGATLGVGFIVGFLTEKFLFGGTIALILFALQLLFPIVKWILIGLPAFLLQMQVDSSIVTGLTALMALVWFWFILGFVGQRRLER